MIILCHHPFPSLLGSGSKPLQLFGLRKTPELSLALRQAQPPWGRTGSVPATGGWLITARSHILPDFLDTSSSNGRLVDNRPFAHSARLSGHKGRWPSSRTLDGLRWTWRYRRRTALKRTAKSCGPDASALASSS